MLSEPWRIQLLGGLAATLHDVRIEHFRSRKAATLVAYLALHNRTPTPREFLGEMLWPEEDIDTSRNRLRVTLASLRRQFEPPPMESGSVIVANRSHISFREGQIVIDVDQFRLATSRAARIDGELERTRDLQNALDLYRGELLPGLYEDWIDEERRALEHLYQETVTKVTDLLCNHGETAQALPYALRLAGIDPLDEQAQCRLMRVYGALGQPGKAADTFEVLRVRLRDELGAEPAAATNDLIAEVRRGEGNKQPHLSFTNPPAINPQVVNPPAEEPVAQPIILQSASSSGVELPTATSSFHGRESEINHLTSLLAPANFENQSICDPYLGRLLTLSGVGGIGKTRLALQAALSITPNFPGGLWFVPLVEVEDGSQLPQAIADGMRLRLVPNKNLIDQVVDEIAGRSERGPTLLVLDNFEQLVETGSEIIELLLARIPALWVMATSRRLLGIDAEREFHVDPLEVSFADLDVDEVFKSAGVALFVARARAARPDFQLTTRNAQAVTELCRQLDGIPLAIELAAARIRLLTPDQMIAEMDRRFDLLVNRRAQKDSRHRSLRAVIESSIQMLSLPAKEFLALLSVFRGSWNLEAAKRIYGDVNALDMLDDLVGCSLIQTRIHEGEMRYSMLETIREYAAGLLADERQEQVNERHSRYFAGWTEVCENYALSSQRDRVCAQYEVERENIRAAWAWTLKHDIASALDTAANLRWVFFFQHRLREGEEMLLQSLQAAGNNHPQASARALVSLGALRCYMDDFARAREPLLAALEQLDAGQERENRLAILFKGWMTAHEGNFDEAIAQLEEARRLCDENGETWLAAGCQNIAGFAACYAGRLALARELFAISRERFLNIGDPAIAAHSPLGMGRASWIEGKLDESEVHYRTALAEFRHHRDKRGTAYSLEGLARVASGQTRHIDAMRLTGAAQRIRDQIALRLDPMDQAAHDGVVNAAALALNGESLKAAWDQGYMMGETAAD